MHIHDLRRIRPMLDLKTASTIAKSIVRAKLDYCNSLFLNINTSQINRLQAIQNALARVVTKIPKHHHITPILKRLHWLKIPERIEYKAISLTYNTLQSSQPSCLHASTVHDPTCSLNVFLFRPNTAPPFCHLVTQICWSIYSHSCPASLEQTPTSTSTTI